MTTATVQKWLDDEEQLHFVADIDGDGVPDHDQIEKALEKAADEMMGWLAARYPTIPSAAKATLEMHQVKIATHRLARTAQASTDDIKDDYKASIDYLKAVAGGRADLPGTTPAGDAIDSGEGGIQMEAPDRIFSRDSLRGF